MVRRKDEDVVKWGITMERGSHKHVCGRGQWCAFASVCMQVQDAATQRLQGSANGCCFFEHIQSCSLKHATNKVYLSVGWHGRASITAIEFLVCSYVAIKG
mmetsp:Transcript_35731/g.63849  ORF Transcript_35731/g.63849 Transcript_35731/m.63849 type:complete len:101 (+) Transcript_35731:2027-2329(+)